MPEGWKHLVPSNLLYEEKEYRRAVLEAIERSIQEKGEHVAHDHPERARQFMPFAALKGYEDLLEQENARSAQIR